MDRWGRNLKVTLDVGFCGWSPVDFGVMVDEGEILALFLGIITHFK